MSSTEALFSVPDDDAEFIAQSMEHLGLTSDAQLEALANLATYTLSKARQGAQQLGPWNRAKILDLRCYSGIRDTILAVFGNKGREWIALDRRRMVDRADSLVARKTRRRA